MTGYYSLLEDKLDAIPADHHQPLQRQMLYDLTRYALKSNLSTRDPSLTAGQIHDQIILLEMAIALVEANAANRDAFRNRRRGLHSTRNPAAPLERRPIPTAELSPNLPPERNPTPPTELDPPPPTEVNASPPAEDVNFEVTRPPSRPAERHGDLVVLPPRNLTRSPYANDEYRDGYYPVPANTTLAPEIVELIQMLARERKSTSRRVLSLLDDLFRFAFIAAVGFGVYAVWSGRTAEFAGRVTPPATETVVAPAVPVTPTNIGPSVPRPTVFGVYAVQDGRLTRLEQVPTTPVDPRTRNLQQITTPSRTVFPDGRLAFTVYRRDLVASAPVSVPVRFAARIAGMLRYGPTGTLVMSRPDTETWLIYNAGFEFRALPVPDNREMILLRPDDPDLVLPAGRYVLLLNDQPYEFSVAGNVTDPNSCVEGTPTPRGPVFYQCK